MALAASRRGKQTIAEYVTDEPTLELLRSYGVDHAQGFHIGWPADPLDLSPHILRSGTTVPALLLPADLVQQRSGDG